MKDLDNLVRLDTGLFPNIKSEPHDLLAFLDNGARAIRIGGINKRSQYAEVKLHRVRPGEPRQTLDLPMIFLERVE